MIASPLRLRPATRLAALSSLLPDGDAPERQLLARVAAELLDAWTLGSGVLRPLADADPGKLLPVAVLTSLDVTWRKQLPAWPEHLEPHPVWRMALFQYQWLQRVAPGAGFGDGERDIRAALGLVLGVVLSLQQAVAQAGPGLDADLCEALLATLMGQHPKEPRALATRIAIVGRHLPGLVPLGELERLIAQLEAAEHSDAQALHLVRSALPTAGDKVFSWLLQGVVAMLEGPPPAAGLASL